MNENGFWAGEEDESDMYFGPSTQEALCYFQASVQLPETGFVDADTWRALIGEERFIWGPPPGAIGFDEEAAAAAAAARSGSESESESDPAPPPLTASAASAAAWSKTIVPMNDNVDTGEDDGPQWGDAERNEPNEGAFYRKVFHPPLGFNI